MLQRLPIVLAQVIPGNTFNNLLNKICQIRHYFYRAENITENVYSNIINLVNL